MSWKPLQSVLAFLAGIAFRTWKSFDRSSDDRRVSFTTFQSRLSVATR